MSPIDKARRSLVADRKNQSTVTHGTENQADLDLLVIVLNYRTPDLTIDCLASLASEVEAVPNVHVTVVENGSGDDSCERIRGEIEAKGWSTWATLIDQPENLGFAGGNNLAWRKSPSARYLLLLNSDTVVRRGSLRYCYDVMQAEPSIGAMGIRQILRDGSVENSVRRFPTPLRMFCSAIGLPWRSPKLFGWANVEDVSWDRQTVRRDVDWIGGAFLMVRGGILLEIGGLLDEDFFFTGEDIEFCHRLRRAGYRCVYDPTVAVHHMHGGSSDADKVATKQMMKYTLAARYLVQRKCYGQAAAAMLRLLDIQMWGMRLLWPGLTGRRKTDKYIRASQCFSVLIRPLSVSRRRQRSSPRHARPTDNGVANG